MRECLAVVDRNKTKLMVGFNRRFDPHFMAVKAAIDAGEIGPVAGRNYLHGFTASILVFGADDA